MALTQLTKIDGGGISTTSDYRVGVITATKFVGPIEGAITSTDATFTGNVSIGGTLTYEDVTNIDSVGIITAQSDIHVGAGVSAVGVGTFSGLDISGDIDVDGHTELDNLNVSGIGTFNGIRLIDNKSILLGTSDDMRIRHTGSHSQITDEGTGSLRLGGNQVVIGKSDFSETSAVFTQGAGATLKYANNTKFATTNTGVSITGNNVVSGNVTAVDGTFSGNVSIAGVVTATTFSGSGASLTGIVNANVAANAAIAGSKITPNFGSQTLTAGLVYSNGLNSSGGLSLTGGTVQINFNRTNHSPTYRMVLTGGSNPTMNFRIRDTTNNLDRFMIRHAGQIEIPGDVGIGHTVNFSNTNITKFGNYHTLHIKGPSNEGAAIRLQDNGDTADSDDFVIYKNQNGGYLRVNGTDPLIAHMNGADRLTITSTGEVRIPSGSNSTSRLTFGGGINIYHDGNMKFENSTGYLKLQSSNNLYIDGSEIFFRNAGGTNRWRILTTGHLVPGAAGTYDIGSTTAEIGDVYLADDKRLKLGSDQDMQIFHNNTHGYVANRKNNLYLEAVNYVMITSADTNGSNQQTSARFLRGGASDLYHSNTLKFSTSSTGVTVTGEVAASQDYPNFRPTLDLNFAAEKKLDPRITFQRTGIASFVNEFGLIKIVGDNTPRFNHDPITRESKGLLIEVQRTNLLKYSVDFASIPGYIANYSAARSTLTSTTELAPDGTNTASKYVRTAGQGTGEVAIIVNPIGTSSGSVYTTSVFVKNFGTNGIVELVNVRATSVNDDSQFNLANGTITTEGSDISLTTITPYPNDWYRISVTATANNNGYFWVRTYNQPEGSGFILWGGQIEAGSFPSSYIPTYDNASVQRGHEKVFIDGEDFSDFYNPTESTVVCEFDSSNWLTANNNAYERIWSINNGSESDVFEMFKSNIDNNNIRYRVRDGAANVLGAANISYGTNTTPKMAFALKLNDAAVAVDGTIGGTSDTGIPMPTVDRLILGNDDNFSNNTLNGHIKRFMYYPVKLSDSQVVTITS